MPCCLATTYAMLGHRVPPPEPNSIPHLPLNDDDELDYAEFDDDKNADRGGGGLGRGASGLASYATTRLHKDGTHTLKQTNMVIVTRIM
jgi:hypothetical protein